MEFQTLDQLKATAARDGMICGVRDTRQQYVYLKNRPDLEIDDVNVFEAPVSSDRWVAEKAVPATETGDGPGTIASQAEAEAGEENTKAMTALRVKQAIDALGGGGGGGGYDGLPETVVNAGSGSLDNIPVGTGPEVFIALVGTATEIKGLATADENKRVTLINFSDTPKTIRYNASATGVDIYPPANRDLILRKGDAITLAYSSVAPSYQPVAELNGRLDEYEKEGVLAASEVLELPLGRDVALANGDFVSAETVLELWDKDEGLTEIKYSVYRQAAALVKTADGSAVDVKSTSFGSALVSFPAINVNRVFESGTGGKPVITMTNNEDHDIYYRFYVKGRRQSGLTGDNIGVEP